MVRCLVFTAVFAAIGCHCRGPTVDQLGPAVVEVSPTRLTFPATYVGATGSLTLDVAHLGGSPASLTVGPAALPFSATPPSVDLSRGERASVRVDFAPQSSGPFSATLRVGEAEVQLEGEGLEQPACTPPSACVGSSFDVGAASCVEAPRPDGTACSSRCVANGTCNAAVCLGTFAACDDQNACTLDACSEAQGCSHPPRTCPAPTGACRVARCDTRTGCLEEDAPDGTLCGVDDCLATTVDVCLLGQCTQRPRPDDGRCVNRWVPTQLDNDEHALAYDAVRQREVLVGAHTWESDGAAWTLSFPAISPPPRRHHAVAWDAARRRTVLFGGVVGEPASERRLNDTWEWDGKIWVERHPQNAPPPRRWHAMAYDEARQRLVLYGGWGGTPTGTASDDVLGDTWEWDGNDWSQRHPATSPPVLALHTLAYDSARQRTVMVGGFGTGAAQVETWEWDGTTWVRPMPAVSPPKRSNASMTFDPFRSRTVLYGGTYVVNGASASRGDTWEWDGTTWTERTPALSPPPGGYFTMAFDVAKRRSVLVAGAQTWEWDGASWTRRPGSLVARLDGEASVAWDSARRQVVTFTAIPPPAETWLWSAAGWSSVTPAVSPTPRWRHEVAYDSARQRVVLYGGAGNGTRVDTWEWDGSSWSQHVTPVNPGERDRHAMAYDEARHRVVLFGGFGDAVTWEWDGSAWTPHTQAAGPVARYWHALVWHGARQRVVLIGGTANGTNQPLDDVWEWDGTAWSQLPSTAGVNSVVAAYDEARQVVVVPGAQTREWDGTTWTTRTPFTPPPQRCSPVYDGALHRVVCFSPNSSTPYVYLP